MAKCYLCGSTPAQYRRTVSTGTSYRTSYTKKGPTVHRYDNYGERSVCARCALQIDYTKKKLSYAGLIGIIIVFLIIMYCFIQHISHDYGKDNTPYGPLLFLSVLITAFSIFLMRMQVKEADKWYEANKSRYLGSVDNSAICDIVNNLTPYTDSEFNRLRDLVWDFKGICNKNQNLNDYGVLIKKCDEIIGEIDNTISIIKSKVDETINYIINNYPKSDAKDRNLEECRKIIERFNLFENDKSDLSKLKNDMAKKLTEVGDKQFNGISTVLAIPSNSNNEKKLKCFNDFLVQIQPKIIEINDIIKDDPGIVISEYKIACERYGYDPSYISIFDIIKADIFITATFMRYKTAYENLNKGISVIDRALYYCPDINTKPLVNYFNSCIKKQEANIFPQSLNVLLEMVKKAQEKKTIAKGLSKDGYAFVTYEFIKIMKVIADDFFECGIIKASAEENATKEDIIKTILMKVKEALNDKDTMIDEGKLESKQQQPNKEKTELSSLEIYLKELNELVGLKKVKEEVTNLVNLVKVRKMREENGLKQVPLSLHLVFSGNPGTGKTTVARILANIYKELGVISKGHLVETDRSGLVAGYVGQTAIKTQEVIQSAKGGILFIDEAYSLSSKSENDFGVEAIDTLLKAMEDMRNDFIVIVAGYPDLMKNFLKSNPGLESRFNTFIDFEDYESDDLFAIFLGMCDKNNYKVNSSLHQKLKEHFEEMYSNRNDTYANARTVRNFFENAVKKQANRVSIMNSPSKDDLVNFTEEDLF